jgi:hypothetical protein
MLALMMSEEFSLSSDFFFGVGGLHGAFMRVFTWI